MNRLKLDPVRHLAVPAALLAMVAMGLLAETLPLGGRAPRELLAMFENLFTPAPYALSIWWVIYVGLAMFTLYQFLPSQANDPVVARVDSLFMASSLLYIAWLFAWHFLWTGVSVVLMALLTAAVLIIYLQVTRRRNDRTPAHRFMVALPFRIYLGWLIFSLLANIMAWVRSTDPSFAPLGESGWALVLIAATVVIGAALFLLKKDLFLNLALIWGLVALAVGQSAETAIMLAALLGAVLLVALIVLQAMRGRNRPQAPGAVKQAPLPERGR